VTFKFRDEHGTTILFDVFRPSDIIEFISYRISSVVDVLRLPSDDKNLDGNNVGTPLGTEDGVPVGITLGIPLGRPDGTLDGNLVGTTLGTDDGIPVGIMLGKTLGRPDGTLDGNLVGTPLGTDDDIPVGIALAIPLGVADGTPLGPFDGIEDGILFVTVIVGGIHTDKFKLSAIKLLKLSLFTTSLMVDIRSVIFEMFENAIDVSSVDTGISSERSDSSKPEQSLEFPESNILLPFVDL
jgi:hypothetical protein